MKKIILLFVLLFSLTGNTQIQKECISYSAVYNLILEIGIEFPDIVFAQSVLESGHYKSKVFNENNNIFGMRFPVKRNTTAILSKNGYAVYEFWQESVMDYLLYQKYILGKKKMTREEYFKYLDKRYASTKGYSKKIKSIIFRYKNILYEPPFDRNDGNIENNLI